MFRCGSFNVRYHHAHWRSISTDVSQSSAHTAWNSLIISTWQSFTRSTNDQQHDTHHKQSASQPLMQQQQSRFRSHCFPRIQTKSYCFTSVSSIISLSSFENVKFEMTKRKKNRPTGSRPETSICWPLNFCVSLNLKLYLDWPMCSPQAKENLYHRTGVPSLIIIIIIIIIIITTARKYCDPSCLLDWFVQGRLQPASLKKWGGTKIMHIFVKIGGGKKN